MRIFLCFIIFSTSIPSVYAQHWQESFEKAKIAFDGGNFIKASALASEALAVAQQRHGENSNEAVNTLQILVQSEKQAGKLPEAIVYASQLKLALEKITGKDHILYARSVQSHGNLLIENEQLSEALKLYSSNKQTIQEQYIDDNIAYSYFLSDLAFLYLNAGDEDNAIQHYKEGIELIEQSGTEKTYLMDNITSVKNLLIKKKLHNEVIRYGRKLLSLGQGEPLITTRIDIADAYTALNKNDSAQYFLLSAKSHYDKGEADKDKLFSYVVNQLAYFSSVDGNRQQSQQYIQEGNATATTDKTTLFNQAIIAQNRDDLEVAAKHYEQLFALNENDLLDSREKIRLYDYLTLYHIKTNDYNKAFTYSQKALEAAKEEYGKKSKSYLSLISHQALVEKSFGHYIKAREIYEPLVEDIEKLDLITSSLYVDVMSNYATTVQHLNEFHLAKAKYKGALDIAFQINYKKENLAVLLNNYAVILQLNGDFVEAEINQKKALKLIKESYGEDHPNYAYNFINLGEIYIKQGNFSGADSVFSHSKNLISTIFGKDSPEYAMVMISATNVDTEFGRYAKADKAYLAALQRLENAGSAYQLELAYGLNDYGLLLQKLGNYSLAERNFKSAADIFKKKFGEVNTDYVSSLGNLANLYQMQDKDTEAEQFLNLVLKIDEQLYGKRHPKYSTTLHNLASLYQKQKKIDDAVRLYSAALKIDSIIYGTAHHSYANTLYNLADLYDTRGEYTKALVSYRRVLEIMESVYGTENPEYVYRLYGLARLNQRLRKNEAALNLYRQINRSYLHQIQEYFPVLSEDQKGLFYAKVSPVFNGYRELLLNINTDELSTAGELLNLQLHTKAILLNASNRLRTEISNSQDIRIKQLYSQLIQNKNKLVNYYNYSQADLESEGIDLQKLEDEVNLFEKELSQKLELFSEVHESDAVSWENIQTVLKPDEVVVEIVRVEETMNDGKITYAALILAKDFPKPHLVIFKNGNGMEGASYNFYRNALSYDIQDDKSFNAYWEPIHALTSGYSKVYISPDGIFNKLSFNTLYDDKSGKYLIDNQMISLISATKDLLKRNEADEAASKTAALFGYPIFNTDQTAIASGEAVNRLYEEWMTDIDLLPGTKVEINNIESTLPAGPWSISKKLEFEASEKNVKNLNGPSVLHIATHGYFSEDLSYTINAWKDQEKTEEYDFNPLLRSGLLFSKAETTVRKRLKGAAVNTNDDGILTAYEAMNLNLRGTDLVVLSACETGLGAVRNGEGVYGLQRAFLVSGAKNLIMSLWKVNDKVTQELMSSFYKKWTASGDLHDALRKAQLEIKEKHQKPSLWGGFILNGL